MLIYRAHQKGEIYMQFKEALRAAGLANPGRTTWSGVTPDGTSVFTIWEHEIYKVDGRWFASWNHDAERDDALEVSSHRVGTARKFIERASESIGHRVRVVIVVPKRDKEGKISVGSAVYPDPRWSSAVFRFADQDSRQFVAELFFEETAVSEVAGGA